MEQPQQDHNEPRSNEPQLVASPNNSPWEARVPLARHVTFRVIRLLEEGTLREFVKEVWPSRNVDLAAMQASEVLELIIQHLDELPDAVGCLEAIEKAAWPSSGRTPLDRQTGLPHRLPSMPLLSPGLEVVGVVRTREVRHQCGGSRERRALRISGASE